MPEIHAPDFESLALPHLEAVARFALSLTRDRADADDLVQETFLRAFRGWHTYRPDGDARRWLFAICRNAFVRGRRRAHRFVGSDEGDLDALPAVEEHARAQSAGHLEALATLDVRPAIRAAIDALPEPHHGILVLVDLEEHSYEEAAAVLEIPVGTVRSRLYRARRMVQAALLAHAADAGVARAATTPRPARPPVPEASPAARPTAAIDCTTAMRRLWGYLDGALAAADADAVRAHVADCVSCRAHTTFERSLLASIRDVRAAHDDVAALRDGVLRILREAGSEGPRADPVRGRGRAGI